MRKRLYVSDLDGTLLNMQGEMSDFSVNKLNALIESGVHITVASARGLKSIRKLLQNVTIKLPVISFNGGYISDFQKNTHLIVNDIDIDLAKELFTYFDKGVLISTYGKKNDALYRTPSVTSGTHLYLEDRQKDLGEAVAVLNTLDALDGSSVMAYTYIDSRDQVMAMKAKLQSRYGQNLIIHAWQDMYYPPWYWMTIHSKESTKGHGLSILKQLTDIHYDELVVFGDNINDLEMFELADHAIAVENAVGILKARATEVIGHHDEDSVVKKIMAMEGWTNGII